MEGVTVGVFGTDQAAKTSFESAVAKKSEAEGIVVYHRTESGRRTSFLDTTDFPQKVQGYARIASIVDYALYLFPQSGSLTAPDGELAVLIGAFSLSGTLVVPPGPSSAQSAVAALKGTGVAEFRVDERIPGTSTFDAASVAPREGYPSSGTLVYVDRAFSVKGVGTVALGFVLFGRVSVHDTLRPIPAAQGTKAEVRGIQVNDVDYDSAGRGLRVGLSLRDVEPKDLEKCRWLDDGTLPLSESLDLRVSKSPFYKQPLESRDLHLQLPGELVPARLSSSQGGILKASLTSQVPVWDGMRGCVVDLNGKGLRIAAGTTCKL